VDLDRALEVALRAAGGARSAILGRRDAAVEWKADQSEVTAADRSAEQAIRAVIGQAFPDHAIVGEEFGGAAGQEWTWLVDPIDGTISFVHGLPLYATLIALCRGREPVVAVVDLPGLDRRLHAVQGHGAWEGDRRLQVGAGFDPYADLVARGDRYQFEAAGRLPLYERLERELRLFRTYVDAHGHCLVATGAAALMVDPDLRPWDIAAPSLIVREAGGRVLTLPEPSGKVTAISGNREAVAWLEERLQG
jgi:histidinol phosphatase-like enzyme (inositol monophosphatase family)